NIRNTVLMISKPRWKNPTTPSIAAAAQAFIVSQAFPSHATTVSQFLYRATPAAIRAAIPATTQVMGLASSAELNSHCAAVIALLITIALLLVAVLAAMAPV